MGVVEKAAIQERVGIGSAGSVIDVREMAVDQTADCGISSLRMLQSVRRGSRWRKKPPSISMATFVIATIQALKYAPRFQPVQDKEERDVFSGGDVHPVIRIAKRFDNRGRGHCNSTGRRGSRNFSRHATAQFLTFTLAEPSYLPGTKCLSFLTQPMARNDLYEELRAINRGSG